MALPVTPRLDNLAAMQSRPLGTNTAMYRDPSTEAMTRQYRQQKSDYDMARRLLRRRARRGDAGAALNLLQLGRDAQKEDVQFGMEAPEQRGAVVARRVTEMQRGVIDANRTADIRREEAKTNMGLGKPDNFGLTPQTPRLDAMARPEPAAARPEPAGFKRKNDWWNKPRRQ